MLHSPENQITLGPHPGTRQGQGRSLLQVDGKKAGKVGTVFRMSGP